MFDVSREELRSFLAGVDLCRGMGPDAVARLTELVEPVALQAGERLFRTGEPSHGMYLVLDGELEVLVEGPGETFHPISGAREQQYVGAMGLLRDDERSSTVVARTESRLLHLSRDRYEAALGECGELRRLAGQIVWRRLPGFRAAVQELMSGLDDELLAEVQSAFSWLSLARGEVLFRQGDPADALYLVVHGRVQVVIEQENGGEQVVAEIGRGQPVGEMALLADEPRSATVRAVRDSDLLILPRSGFNAIVERSPKAILPLVKTLVARLRTTTVGQKRKSSPTTVALVPLSPDVPCIGPALARALTAVGNVLEVNAERFDSVHGSGASQVPADDPRSLHLREWLNQQEDSYDFILYEASCCPDVWTERCLRQADRIVLVAFHETGPELSSVERWIIDGNVVVPQELVLIHKRENTRVSGTADWLNRRRVERHYHVQMGVPADLERVARFLSDRAVGLVLGGGGARAFAHMGVIRALRECGIPIDYVGGTSMGSFIGAMVAAAFSEEQQFHVLHRVLVDRPRGYGYTLPLIALFQVKRAEQTWQAVFGEQEIPDLWLSFFCVSTNITRAQMVVHRNDRVWWAIRASMAIPGLLPPVFHNGDLLVDGALLNNVPVDVMDSVCPGPIIACDVGRAIALRVDNTLENCPSVGRMLLDRFTTKNTQQRLPNLASILTRSMDCGAVMNKHRCRDLARVYLTPPVDQYGILDMDKISAIVDVGYRHALNELRAQANHESRDGEFALTRQSLSA